MDPSSWQPTPLDPYLGEAVTGWTRASGQPSLLLGQVHVWVVALAQPVEGLQALQPLLSQDELERVRRFRFPHLQDAFLVGRGVLRVLLGQYLAADPQDVGIEYGPGGKPEIPGGELQFNLAHSGKLAVYAFSRDRRIGVDLEVVKPMPDLQSVARRFFSEPEVKMLMSLPEAERRLAFFTCWTRKEAYIKATGHGLAQPLDGFAVTLLPGEPARLAWVDGDPGAGERWQLAALPLGPHYQGALMVEGAEFQLVRWRW